MTTDFRALCVELTDCLEKADWPHRYKVVFQQWTDIAHAALSEPDGPAVSGDREPASVAKQYSGELSPAARSVFESFNSKFKWVEDGVPGPQFSAIAAALRAAVDQVVPLTLEEELFCRNHSLPLQKMVEIRRELNAIADELETH